MDANQTSRTTVPVTIAGRAVDMIKPTSDQLVGLTMFNSPYMPEGAKIKALTDMFLVLLPTDEDRGWFMEQLIGGNWTVKEMATTLTAVATYNPDTAEENPAKAPAKRTAKRTAKKV
jgi:hypothetical protein